MLGAFQKSADKVGVCKSGLNRSHSIIPLCSTIGRLSSRVIEILNFLLLRIYFVGLECRMRKTYISTIKGKREKTADGILVGPQTLEINEFARELMERVFQTLNL